MGEVPIGCVVVFHENEKDICSGKANHSYIIATGKNATNETYNATRHAEIEAIEKIWNHENPLFRRNRAIFKHCIVYVSVEPCIMCIMALRELSNLIN
jgi:tRNA-specific adenosine deaminase 2